MSGRSEPLKKENARTRYAKKGFVSIHTPLVELHISTLFSTSPPFLSYTLSYNFFSLFWYGRLGASDSSSGAVCAVNTGAAVSDTWKEQGGGVWEYADKWCFHCCTCYCFFWAHHYLPCCHWCSHLCR